MTMPKTNDSIWSFNLRTYNPNDFSDSESDDSLPDNLCSDGSTLVDQPLSEDNDTAIFKPNPWSIAKINAASRSAQKYAPRLWTFRTIWLASSHALNAHICTLELPLTFIFLPFNPQ